MAEIRIELRDFTDNILGNLDIISSDDFPLSLTFQNFDVRDLGTRNGSFSKTFTAPSTKNNNILFNQIYKEGNIDIKKVRKEIPSTIYADNIPIINGLLRMSSITKTQDPLGYECIFLGDSMDWANGIKSLNLKDMKFSSSSYSNYLSLLDGTITPTSEPFLDPQDVTQHPSTHSDYVQNQDKLIYPLLSVGEGVSPKDHVTDLDMIPCVYLKNIWDKVFQGQGYTVQSEFCNSDFFKSLIVPLEFERNGEQVNTRYGLIEKNDDIDEKVSVYEYDGGNQVLTRAVGDPNVNKRYGSVVSGIDVPNVTITTTQYAKFAFYGNEFTDAADTNPAISTSYQGNVRTGNSGLGSSMVVVNNSGVHELKWDVNAVIAADEPFSTFLSLGGTLDMRIHAEVWRTNLTDNPQDLYYDDIDEALTRTTGSRLIWKSETIDRHITEEQSDDNLEFEQNFSGSFNTVSANNASQSYIFVVVPRVLDYAGSSSNAGKMSCEYRSGTFEVIGSSEFAIGENIDNIQYLLPKGSQSDFISGVSQLFNLQFKTDAFNKTVYVEPYDYFYSFDGALDWTDKIDYSKDIKESFIYDLKSKIILKYKDASNDAFLERYNKKNDVDWGAYEENNETGEFVDGKYILENKFFSPSFNWFEPDYIDDTATATNINNTPLIPIYHKDFSNINTNVPSVERSEKSFDIGARILLLKDENPYMDAADKTKNVGKNGTWQRYHQATDNVIENESTFKYLFAKAAFINFNASHYEQSTTYRTRAYISIGTFNGSEKFIDHNLSFSDVKQTLYLKDSGGATNGVITQKGLFHNFYSKMINQLKSKPRIKTLYVDLTYNDILNLDFTKLIVINGIYHRINKILDYQPHKKQSTKLELIEYYDLGYDEETLGVEMDLSSNNINL